MPAAALRRSHEALARPHRRPGMQAHMRRLDMPDEYPGPDGCLSLARAQLERERALVMRLNLSID